ncbi:alpha/beta hydrolase family protein [Phenylobacterium montanum]|uniref:Dienelactone hydrolase n=1 Tax=Phenylobacterium montanum TaxID=2823693 RepID=A0A975G1X1_9CAUL|nr:dienelactone hydrolase [Caulobacter sp. S6]QUD89211.1 dienelactone hydrolase [Caulobacter sp. S6]
MLNRLALIGLLVLAPALVRAAEPSANVGFDSATVPSGAGPAFEMLVWYPTDAAASPQRLGGWTQAVAPGAAPAPGRHPLVVISHGNGGWAGGHYDTALALAHAGFVVAALTHPGDNYEDMSRQTDMPDRPRDLHRLIDFMLEASREKDAIDPARVGAFGFSAGGFTVLVEAGGVPDYSTIRPHCDALPDNFDCKLSRMTGKLDAPPPPASAWTHDLRVKAVVSAAPGLAFTFLHGGLKGVTVPVQIWRAEYDHVLPSPDYAEAARDALPGPADYHVAKNADHYDFLAPCSADMAKRLPEICTSRPGFDRVKFHEDFDAAVVAFFQRAIG